MDGSVKSFVGNGLYSNSIPSLSYPFTLSCWVYKTDDAAYGIYLLDKDASNIYFGIALGADDKVYMQAANTTAKNTYSNSTYTNQWVHITAVFESATDRNLYINGVQNTDNENNDSVTYSNIDRISVGYMGDSSPTYSGSEIIVDGVCIFNKSLSNVLDSSIGGSEIGLLYNGGQPHNLVAYSKTIKSTSDLVGYWQNNNLESTGKWEDLSSNTNHLTANDTPGYIFFQEGITSGKDSQGFPTNIIHPSNGALHLNGSSWAGSGEGDYADVPSRVDIDGDFSVEMWRKLTREFQGNKDGYVLGADNVDFLVIPYVQSSGKISQVYIRTNSGDNNTITLDTSTIAKVVGTSSQAQGFIDELKIYDKALTVAEAKKNYNHGKSKHSN